jgi:hypothetical protein
MPEFKPYVNLDFEDQFDEVAKEWERRTEEWEKIVEKNAPAVAKPLGEAIKKEIDKSAIVDYSKFDAKGFKGASEKSPKAKKDGKSGGGEKSTLDSAFDKIQVAALKTSDVPKEQLAEQKKGNTLLARLAAIKESKASQKAAIVSGKEQNKTALAQARAEMKKSAESYRGKLAAKSDKPGTSRINKAQERAWAIAEGGVVRKVPERLSKAQKDAWKLAESTGDSVAPKVKVPLSERMAAAAKGKLTKKQQADWKLAESTELPATAPKVKAPSGAETAAVAPRRSIADSMAAAAERSRKLTDKQRGKLLSESSFPDIRRTIESPLEATAAVRDDSAAKLQATESLVLAESKTTNRLLREIAGSKSVATYQ